jgi:hypothetical protein
MLLVVTLVCVLAGVGFYSLSSYFTNRSYYWQEQGESSKSERIQKFSFIFRWLIGADVLALIVYLMATLGR